jgi:hypothetical protein
MKSNLIYMGILCVISSPVVANDFCDGSKFVKLDHVLSSPDKYINSRVRTRAILKTDAKEYTRISLDENSKFSVLTTADDESTTYGKRHNLSVENSQNVVDDLFEKLRAVEGSRYKPDMSKIRYYRQDVVICGRLVRSMGELRFAVDDMHIEDSYLVPFKIKKNS